MRRFANWRLQALVIGPARFSFIFQTQAQKASAPAARGEAGWGVAGGGDALEVAGRQDGAVACFFYLTRNSLGY